MTRSSAARLHGRKGLQQKHDWEEQDSEGGILRGRSQARQLEPREMLPHSCGSEIKCSHVSSETCLGTSSVVSSRSQRLPAVPGAPLAGRCCTLISASVVTRRSPCVSLSLFSEDTSHIGFRAPPSSPVRPYLIITFAMPAFKEGHFWACWRWGLKQIFLRAATQSLIEVEKKNI